MMILDPGYSYGGTTWSGITFAFYNDKLYGIQFYLSIFDNDWSVIESTYERYSEMLSKKYSSFIQDTTGDELRGVYFNDYKTTLHISISSRYDTNACMSMFYSDVLLNIEYNQGIEDAF